MSGENTPTPAVEWPIEEIEAILERAKEGAIRPEEYAKLKSVIQTFALLKEELQAKQTSIQRLKRMLFGASTEKTREVLGAESTDTQAIAPVGTDTRAEQEDRSEAEVVKRKGHGAAAAYVGADKVLIPHPRLRAGDRCPGCQRGKLFRMKEPGLHVRFTGVAPLQAKVFECDRMRCGSCGEVYKAAAPEEIGEEKYDESVPAVVGLLRYGVGLPFHRIEKLQANFGIPLPSYMFRGTYG